MRRRRSASCSSGTPTRNGRIAVSVAMSTVPVFMRVAAISSPPVPHYVRDCPLPRVTSRLGDAQLHHILIPNSRMSTLECIAPICKRRVTHSKPLVSSSTPLGSAIVLRLRTLGEIRDQREVLLRVRGRGPHPRQAGVRPNRARNFMRGQALMQPAGGWLLHHYLGHHRRTQPRKFGEPITPMIGLRGLR